ncbi:MAG: AbrB/MazE/SpoVT family DNA-binding domain-containing protein [Nanoarchaeota archaeon]|nr:AbrB/MazE/SpoVT family DNA-binding domain-containing protein [Nanoarchaeota archaeon]MBU1855030.1 AbrB/MazE/SpoVT family DNA-binding domain-containing protein [Nanoarchaeota archaeon]
MKKCSNCGKEMVQSKDKTEDGIEFDYYKCMNCGEEILNMFQLHDLADKYREMKKYRAKLSRWGKSLGLRIPKDLEKEYFSNHKEVNLIPEKGCIKIIPV